MTDEEKRSPRTPAEEAFDEAIEAGIREENLYPERAMFIDAEGPDAGRAIAEAAAEGWPVVLCSADGTRHVLYPSEPAAA